MGNEGSVPTGEDEFESQARAPPSAIDPITSQPQPLPLPPPPLLPHHAGGGGGGGNTGGGGATGRSGRMINAVFHRRQQQPSAHQQNPHAPGAPALTPEDMILMSPEQQQLYYQEQQDLYDQQLQQQQYYQQNGYAATAAGAAPTSTSTTTTPTKKTGLNFRPTGRAGAALLNSMKNLSLGASSRGINKSTATQDWETRWDEDDDSDEGAAAEDQLQRKQPAHPPSAAAAAAHSHAPPLARPGMDLPPSMSSPAATTVAMAATALVDTTKPHLITATPEQGLAEDGVEWDTGIYAPVGVDDYEKPNVQMFLPLLRVLGKGSFGKVVLVQKRVGREKGQLFAMKILRKAHLVKRRQIERTRTERKVLSVVNHPFIMRLHYAFQSPDKLYLVLDYCPGGELFFHLSRFRRFPERVARFYSAELLLALGHLHKRGIIYRDLKPENVLLDAEGHVKLGDFGLAKAGIQHACEGATSMCGTPEYMSPEVLAQQGHGFCVDYWGLGMLLYEMMTGLPPWYTTDRTRLFRRLRSAPLDIPNYFSESSTSCVSALLERDQRRRLGVTGIRAAMEHEFFRSISWRALYGRRVEAPIRPCEGWTPSSPDDPTPKEQMQGDHPELDAATANFDNTFTRMPVETDDHLDAQDGGANDAELLEELHEDTFVGFTFDDQLQQPQHVGLVTTTPEPPSNGSRQRSHHECHDIDHAKPTPFSEERHLD